MQEQTLHPPRTHANNTALYPALLLNGMLFDNELAGAVSSISYHQYRLLSDMVHVHNEVVSEIKVKK